MENNPKNQLNIEISDEIAEGKYSNLAIITHSPNEFIVDFAQMMPGTPKAKVRSRVIMTAAALPRSAWAHRRLRHDCECTGTKNVDRFSNLSFFVSRDLQIRK